MAQATTTVEGEIVLAGDLSGDANSPQLRASGVTPGTYAPARRVSVDAKGRVTSVGQMTAAEFAAGVSTASDSQRGVVAVQGPLQVASSVVSMTQLATTSTAGLFSVNSPLIATDGVISVDETALPTATDSVKGLMQVGSGLSVTGGVLSREGGGDATTSSKGVVQVGTGFSASSGTISVSYGDATNLVKGLVQIGSGLNVSGGLISIPVTSASNLGIAQVGTGFNVASGVITPVTATGSVSGVLRVTEGNGLTVSAGTLNISQPDASGSVKGIVQAGSGFSISGGVLSYTSAGDATTSTKGIVQIDSGSYLTISSGVLGTSIPDATGAVKGLVQIDTAGGLSVSSGVVSIALATPSTKGIVQAGSGITLSGGQISMVTDATTSVKGIIQPSSTFFDVSSGVVSMLDATNSTLGVVTTANSANITISAGDMNVGTNIPKLDSSNTYTAGQAAALVTDTFAASYTPDWSVSNTIEVVLTGNMTLNNPTNMVAGGVYTLILTQDATGSRTLTISGSAYKTNQTITLTTTPNKRDVLTFVCISASVILVILNPGF